MKINDRDGDAKLLKLYLWTLLEFIYYLSEMKFFFFLLSNVPWWLIHINLLFQITIQEGIFDIQLEKGLRQIDRNKK